MTQLGAESFAIDDRPYSFDECHTPPPSQKTPSGLFPSWPGLYASIDIDFLETARGEKDSYLATLPPPPQTHSSFEEAKADWIRQNEIDRAAFLNSGGVEDPGAWFQEWQINGGPRWAIVGHTFYSMADRPTVTQIKNSGFTFGLPTEKRSSSFQLWWAVDTYNYCVAKHGFNHYELDGPLKQNHYNSASLSLMLIDGSTGFPVQIYDPKEQRWREYYIKDQPFESAPERSRYLPYLILKIGERPNRIQVEESFYGPIPMIELPKAVAAQALAESGLFKEKTEYIKIGDEVQGTGVFDLKTVLSSEDISSLKQFLTLVPRQYLREWFLQKVFPSLPEEYVWLWTDAAGRLYDPTYNVWRHKKKYEDLVWASFVDLFNEANLEYINKNKLDPWDWEQEKLESFYLSKDQAAMAQVAADIDNFSDAALEQDPKAKAIMEQFASLPKLGDTGLEINRQFAVKELLKRKDYETAQAVVDVFRFINESELADAAKAPIPFDVQMPDGQTIFKTKE